jgi:hypothetical protein
MLGPLRRELLHPDAQAAFENNLISHLRDALGSQT